MLINADTTTNRTEILIENYLHLLKSGVEAEKILVITQNSKKKKEFVSKIKQNCEVGNIGSIKIYSFYGLIYNYILDNWAEVENSIKSDQNRKIIPNLSGLEVSQYILKDCIQEVDFSGYNSKTSLLHQLLRRNSLITINDLSDIEVENRTKILEESYSNEASLALKKYKAKTINLRAFDYIRQINIFQYLYKKLPCPFEYVFLDDADEITPALFSYLEYIKPSIKEFFIGYDLKGSSRLGYLGAINIDFEKFLDEKPIILEETSKSKQAQKILNLIKNDEQIDLKEFSSIKAKSFIKRTQMLDCIIEDTKTLLAQGVKLSEICYITPNCDDFLKTYLQNSFLARNLKFNFISKSEKLNQNPLVGYILELLKIINDKNNEFISPYILKGILIELLKFNPKEAIKLIQEYKVKFETDSVNIFDLIKTKTDFFEKIKDEKLSFQLERIANSFIKFDKDNSKNIIKINQLLKQIYDFEEIFSDSVSNFNLIIQLQNSIISENPLSDDEIDDDSIVVSSVQKIVDYSYKTKYCFMLDINSSNWLKNDIGPLYNAWVMQKKWTKEKFELQDNIDLTKDRTARLLYKTFLLSQNFTLYSSSYDSIGVENFSGIDKYFKFELTKTEKKSKPITPRSDQKEVLNYKGGKMAVSATAGSGKTTIMLLLVEKILSGEILEGIESKNIFVLTFMESAARNFKERIKDKYPDLVELPSISTIHGLALRIIKENNNYAKLGLDADFEIIDELKRANLVQEIVVGLGLDPKKADLYDRAISTYKNELAKDTDFVSSNKLFLNVYNLYCEKLKEQNLIDYDDILLLSLTLLRKNKDVLSYYQELVRVIIEDEAQDSSYTQQSLITLLAGKFNNIIRCGDINQAITTTFTNSDTQGFKNFIKNSKSVVMDRCQRCATGVLDCANDVVSFAKENKIDAFSSLVMKPVEGFNIVDKNAVEAYSFINEQDEQNFILKSVKNILKNDKKATIGILLRNNKAIDKWDKTLSGSLIKTYKNSDSLNNNPLFLTCLLILEYISNPYDLEHLRRLALELYNLGLYDFSSVKMVNNLTSPLFLDDETLDDPLKWDLDYFLYKNHCSIYDLVYEIASFYFSKSKQSSNIPLVSALVQIVNNTQKTFENTVLRLKQIQFKNNFSNIKFFQNENNASKEATVQIMTLHKSKGDEFDYVFIPELTQNNLCFSADELKLMESSTFTQKVKKNPKADFEIKKDIIEENARLIYVGITRAKKKLYLSVSENYKQFSKVKPFKPSEIFEGVEKYAKN